MHKKSDFLFKDLITFNLIVSLLTTFLILGCGGAEESEKPMDTTLVSSGIPYHEHNEVPPHVHKDQHDDGNPPDVGGGNPPDAGGGGNIDPPEELRIGVFVTVQNVNHILEDGLPHGLHTRAEPRLGDRFITGHVFNGAIGEIVDGPIEADNHIWWKIHWNRDNAFHIVTWIPGLEEVCREEICEVWSAQFIKEVKGPVLIRK